MNWYKQAKENYHEFYHGTDSEAFDEFDSGKAEKGETFFNPLGNAMYVTDKKDFARQFGNNVYPVRIPKDAKIKKMQPSKVESAIHDIIRRALKKVKLDIYELPMEVKRFLYNALSSASYSPYDAIMESYSTIEASYPDIANDFGNAISEIATRKFSKFDAVIFVGTNDPNQIFIGESPTQEILIFNKKMQRIFQP